MRAYVLYMLTDTAIAIGISTNRQALYPLKKQVENNYKNEGYKHVPDMWIKEIYITDKATELDE